MKTLIVSLAIAAASATCLAQCQSNRISLNQELHDAGTTMVATVEAAAAGSGFLVPLDGINYIVHVDRVIKGRMIGPGCGRHLQREQPDQVPDADRQTVSALRSPQLQ